MQHGPALIDGSPERHAGRHRDPAVVSAAGFPSGHGSDIRLTLPADAANVVLVRRVVATLADALGLPRMQTEDLKLAVTEACTNVVRHAYADGSGPLEVEVLPSAEVISVVVADRGAGLRPDAHSDGAGLGLPLMAALADGFEFSHEPGLGSRVRMRFHRGG